MKELLSIITISFMEATGFIGFIAGLLGIDLSDMGIGRLVLIVAGVTAIVFIFICTYLRIKQDGKNKMPVNSEKRPTETGYTQKEQSHGDPVETGCVKQYTQICRKSIQTEYIAAYEPEACRKNTKKGMCA